jgi:hypothetical protein
MRSLPKEHVMTFGNERYALWKRLHKDNVTLAHALPARDRRTLRRLRMQLEGGW